MYLLRKGASRDFLHIVLIKAYTIGNKLISKVSAQKKGEKSYDSYKYVFKFGGFRCSPPKYNISVHILASNWLRSTLG